jgi:hypothetical protein
LIEDDSNMSPQEASMLPAIGGGTPLEMQEAQAFLEELQQNAGQPGASAAEAAAEFQELRIGELSVGEPDP